MIFKVEVQDFPVYRKTKADGLLDQKIKGLESRLNPCTLCPRQCKVNRIAGERGYCRAPYSLYVSSAFPHFGEESPLVGATGSGTIFLTHCNLKCSFCQNYDISILGDGSPYSYEQLAALMVGLEGRGCHNINLVTPTHYAPQLVRSLSAAMDRGLSIPIVYNCGGYESLEVIKLLEGIVDIYMPDIKFLDGALSKRYCRAEDYPDVVRAVVREMQRQVGDLFIDPSGIARRGLLIRHLVMPSCGEDTRNVLQFIRDEVSRDAFVNIMAQYRPCYEADKYPEISGRITNQEFREALEFARSIGLTRASHH
jgi:putative pyruvate formate lyase activating enzyme